MPRKVIILGRSEPLFTEFRDSNGSLTNVTNPRIDIYNPEGTIVINSAAPSIQSTGVYYYNFSLSTAVSVVEGLYQIFWSGTIGGLGIQQDEPRYIQAIRIPVGPNTGAEFVNDVRRIIGDDDPDDFNILTSDIIRYINDGVDFVQKNFNLGYTVTKTETTISFDKTLTSLARDLFICGACFKILEHLLHKNLWGCGSLDIGDLSINLTNVNRERRSSVTEMRNEITKTILQAKMNSISGSSIDTYNYGELSETVGSIIRRYY